MDSGVAPWISKGVSATLKSARYTFSYPRGRCNEYLKCLYFVELYLFIV